MQTTPGKLGITSCYCIVSDLVFSRQWAIYSGLLYDLTDYIYTLKQQSDVTSTYSFLDLDIVDIFKQQAGQDITKALNTVLSGKDADTIGKRTPELLDKFVLCQVLCYTEGDDSLCHTIDSLAALNYDDEWQLMFIICNGNIIGSGNDHTTPQIVLDILCVDPKLDP